MLGLTSSSMQFQCTRKRSINKYKNKALVPRILPISLIIEINHMYLRIGLLVACFPMEDEISYGSPMEFTYQKKVLWNSIAQLPFYMVFKNFKKLK